MVEEKEGEVVGGGGKEEVRVLVVDDSPVDRRIVEGLLKRCGEMFEVIAVDSGKKAMEILGFNVEKAESPTVNVQKIDIILTDYCMPEMTGYDLLKAVKEQSCPKSIPVVIMSSENEPQRISRPIPAMRLQEKGVQQTINKETMLKEYRQDNQSIKHDTFLMGLALIIYFCYLLFSVRVAHVEFQEHWPKDLCCVLNPQKPLYQPDVEI